MTNHPSRDLRIAIFHECVDEVEIKGMDDDVVSSIEGVPAGISERLMFEKGVGMVFEYQQDIGDKGDVVGVGIHDRLEVVSEERTHEVVMEIGDQVMDGPTQPRNPRSDVECTFVVPFPDRHRRIVCSVIDENDVLVVFDVKMDRVEASPLTAMDPCLDPPPSVGGSGAPFDLLLPSFDVDDPFEAGRVGMSEKQVRVPFASNGGRIVKMVDIVREVGEITCHGRLRR